MNGESSNELKSLKNNNHHLNKSAMEEPPNPIKLIENARASSLQSKYQIHSSINNNHEPNMKSLTFINSEINL